MERPVWFGSGVHDKSADVVVLHDDKVHPYIIFEVKKPNRKDGLQQLKSYCNAEGSPIGVWSNGGSTVVLHREEPNVFSMISSIPTLGQTLLDVVVEPWTIDKLSAGNRLVRERLSLKRIILDLEDLVLANAGVDAFEEVFKLLYAKLYDEWAALHIPARARALQFRHYGESPEDLKRKIDGLLSEAKRKWPDVFAPSDRIELSAAHLLTCVTFLQDVKLFNANLQIIDEAFEYLVTQVAKGSKGQYFTPRWVIDMCIKMLNPQAAEFVLDPAAGSCGFLVHAIMWIARGTSMSSGLPDFAREFAQNNVYAIDFDSKAIKIAKAMNLIAGDGKTNVYKANSLDPGHWEAPIKAAFSRFVSDPEQPDEGDRVQSLDFDVILTNPPFAGQVRERDILRHYRVAERHGRTVARMGRDALFVERCLKFLRPGGRMAIVLPQGRLNNSTDLYVREFILGSARVLAVVGLHPFTFRPHTGTKTSVVFLQKYTVEELRARAEATDRHLGEWERHLEELRGRATREGLAEEDLPDQFRAYLNSEFPDEPEPEGEEPADSTGEPDDVLTERLEKLNAELAAMPPRARGRADLRRAIAATQRATAAQTTRGKTLWALEDPVALAAYKSSWLLERSSADLDYPIFFAVSQKPGKDSGGDPVLRRGLDGAPVVDEYGHLIVDHDLDEIAAAYAAFARGNGLAFWSEA